MDKVSTVDTYIGIFPKETQKLLKQIRTTIRKAAPKAEERISYGMPGYFLNGQLVFFAGYKNHIGFYATPTGHQEFKKELSVYKQGKGSVQFPIDEPLPLDLITRIVKFRVENNLQKANLKKQLKVCKNGHEFYKSSDCPTCPVCEKAKKPKEGFLSLLPAPARRALENKTIKTVLQLSKYSEKEILELHGIGKSSIPILKKALKENKLSFKK